VKSKKIVIFLVVLLSVVLIVSGCGKKAAPAPGEPQKPSVVMHSTISGPTGSGWYPISVLFADIWMDELPEMNITVVEGGAIGNIREVNRGTDAQSGLAFANHFADAIAGRGAFDKDPQKNVMTLGAMYPTWWEFAVLERSNINSLEDFIKMGGYTIPGNPGDASEQIARLVFKHMGYDTDALEKAGVRIAYGGYTDAANQMRDGIIDLVVQGGSPAVPILVEVDTTNPLRILPVPADVLKSIDAAGLGYSTGVPLPANVYKNQTQPVPTVTTMGIFLVSRDLDEDLVYRMTKALWESIDRIRREQPTRGNFMNPAQGYSGIPDPNNNIHPGALRYYKEIGVAK
jgi:TRAP transporter TAXI family solute receptor